MKPLYLDPERLLTMKGRLQKAEAAADQLVKLFVQTTLTLAVQAEHRAAEQHAQQLDHQVNTQSAAQAEISLHQRQLRMQQDLYTDALTHALELHEQQLQEQKERCSGALAELMEQHEQQLREQKERCYASLAELMEQQLHAQQKRHLSAVNELLQQHEQQLQKRHSD